MKSRLGVLLICGCLAGCGSAPNLSGNWKFTVTSSATKATYTATASITQTPPSVGTVGATSDVLSGTLNFPDNPCATAAPLSGRITGSSVVLTITENGGDLLSLTGTVSKAFTAMSGTYSAPVGGCLAGDFGSWAANRS
jgi:hypothetical protein